MCLSTNNLHDTWCLFAKFVFMKKIICTIVILIFSVFIITPVVQADGFTQQDRERLIRLEERMNGFDKRMDGMEKRLDGRIDGLQNFFNQRFDDVDKKFESMNQSIDSRFESMQNLLIGIMSIFGAMVIALMGMILWDRKTFQTKIKIEAVKEIKNKYIKRIINVLKDLAKHDKRVMEILKQHHLL